MAYAAFWMSTHGGAASQLELHHNKPSAFYPSVVSQYGKVEAPPTAAPEKQKAPVDPFDAASILPPVESVAPPQPVFIRPEVTEPNIVAEKGHKCGERDDTLPPRYRFKNMV